MVSEGEFEDLFEHYRERLVSYLRPLMRGGRRADAEDLAQTVWAEAWQTVDKPPAEGGWDRQWSFMTYLRFKANFRVLDFNRRAAPATLGDGDGAFAPPSQVDFDPEEDLAAAVHRELLAVVMRCGGHPHEVLAFCMSRLIHDRGAASGNAAAVASLHGEEPLHALASSFAARYAEADFLAPASASAIGPAIHPLAERLVITGSALLARDGVARRFYLHLAGSQVGGTRLRDYFLTDSPPNTVAKWTNKVKVSLLETIANPAARCRRCRCYPVSGCPNTHASTGDGPVQPWQHLHELELGALAQGTLNRKARLRAFEHTVACPICDERLRAWRTILDDPSRVLAGWMGMAEVGEGMIG